MKSTTQYIKKGQRMIDIIPIMQTNTIYDKGIPGIGATTMEIDADRSSIIVLPFVPVIEGKKYDNDNNLRTDILGVYGGKYTEHIVEYLESRGNKKRKILCTPEKFPMVKQAILDQKEDLYNDYFILLDECETIIKDIDFREKIKLPLEDFFLFKGKAMVSATPIIPRDSRFTKNRFTHVKIRPHPKWKSYKVDLDLIKTNNVVSVLREYINDNPDEHLCIFTNCARTISKIIADLKLHEEAKVFCAHRLIIKRFKVTGVKQVYTSWKDSKDGLAKVNFFTSRFFAAVDLKADVKPIVVMASNIYYSAHSKIDPATDAIQISGRFRNGIKKCVHITNTNPDIPNRSKEELQAEVDELLAVYKYLKVFRDRADSNDNRKKWINEMFDSAPMCRMIANGRIDTYLADNLLHNQFVDNYYSLAGNLKRAYEETNYFNVTYTSILRKISDEDIMNMDAVAGAKYRQAVALMLDKYVKENTPFNLDLSYNTDLHEFYMMDEVVFNSYFELGLQFMEDANYNLRKLRRGILNKKRERLKISEQIIAEVYIEFNTNQTITSKEAKSGLQLIYDSLNLDLNATGTDIKEYFETTEAHNIKRGEQLCRGYRLGNKKYDDPLNYKELNSHIQ